MKRERRVLAITGDKEVVVSVLYRGKVWFESIDVRLLKHETSIEDVLKSKYIEQARTILIDEELLRNYSDDPKTVLAALSSMEGKVNAIIVKDEEVRGESAPQSNVLEALRVARKIFYEVCNVVQKSKLR